MILSRLRGWAGRVARAWGRPRAAPSDRRFRFRPWLERLEEMTLPSAAPHHPGHDGGPQAARVQEESPPAAAQSPDEKNAAGPAHGPAADAGNGKAEEGKGPK